MKSFILACCLYLCFLPLTRGSGETYLELTALAVAGYPEIDLAALQAHVDGNRPVLYIGTTDAHHVVFVDATSRDGGMPWTFFEKVKLPQKTIRIGTPLFLDFSDGSIGISPFSDGIRILQIDPRPTLVIQREP